ncbi:hypothetical protein, partial [Staphylococcus capitis]
GFSLFRLEVELRFMGAVLRIVGYCINDRIVSLEGVGEKLDKVKVVR